MVVEAAAPVAEAPAAPAAPVVEDIGASTTPLGEGIARPVAQPRNDVRPCAVLRAAAYATRLTH